MASVRTLFLPVLTALAILLTVVTQHAYALNAVADHSAVVQYRHTGWRIADGDIPDAPTALAQTADGYVWVGTGSGLLQFDGARFIRQPIAPDPKILQRRNHVVVRRPEGWPLDRDRQGRPQAQRRHTLNRAWRSWSRQCDIR